MKSLKHFVFISFLITITACSLSKPEIEDLTWKYNDGYYAGDIFTFKYLNYDNDTAYINDSIKVIILESTKANSFQRERLTIRSLKTGEIGYYTGIGIKK